MISILTCPRPGGVSYLGPLIEAVDAACFKERRLLVCDKKLVTASGWTSVHPHFPGRIGIDNKFPGWVAVEEAARGEDDLLFLEDDVRETYPGALADALAYTVPAAVGFTSFHRSRFTTPGIHPSRKFTLSQAVKIPARSFPWLLKWREICWGDWEAVTGFDTALAEAGRANGWLYEQTETSYFDHVGVVSAVRNDEHGRSVAI